MLYGPREVFRSLSPKCSSADAAPTDVDSSGSILFNCARPGLTAEEHVKLGCCCVSTHRVRGVRNEHQEQQTMRRRSFDCRTSETRRAARLAIATTCICSSVLGRITPHNDCIDDRRAMRCCVELQPPHLQPRPQPPLEIANAIMLSSWSVQPNLTALAAPCFSFLSFPLIVHRRLTSHS